MAAAKKSKRGHVQVMFEDEQETATQQTMEAEDN
jgi:hypothetical protein